jgi:hypothetical protein
MRVRLVAVTAVAVFLALAFGIRLEITGGGLVNGAAGLAQYSGTALYAATVYAGVFVLAPRTRPWVAGVVAIAFCWIVEFFQITGVPAELSDRSVLARLALGRTFDPSDLAWYVVGVLPLVAVQWAIQSRRYRWRIWENRSNS